MMKFKLLKVILNFENICYNRLIKKVSIFEKSQDF